MKKYTGTCKVKVDSNYIYRGHMLKITGIKFDYQNGNGDGVYADGTREYVVYLGDTEFKKSHGYTSTVLHDSHLENIELFEEISLPLDEEECLAFGDFVRELPHITSEELLDSFLEHSKKPSVLPTPDLTTLY